MTAVDLDALERTARTHGLTDGFRANVLSTIAELRAARSVVEFTRRPEDWGLMIIARDAYDAVVSR